ncbi:hypothetical protein BVI2075_1280015 [Burkholderia vietnamiensis]|nr:hypothetical protein BVI2075_1280015 [Burkholderia vietnamiensis]
MASSVYRGACGTADPPSRITHHRLIGTLAEIVDARRYASKLAERLIRWLL